jgi:hypothetical protein
MQVDPLSDITTIKVAFNMYIAFIQQYAIVSDIALPVLSVLSIAFKGLKCEIF